MLPNFLLLELYEIFVFNLEMYTTFVCILGMHVIFTYVRNARLCLVLCRLSATKGTGEPNDIACVKFFSNGMLARVGVLIFLKVTNFPQ